MLGVCLVYSGVVLKREELLGARACGNLKCFCLEGFAFANIAVGEGRTSLPPPPSPTIRMSHLGEGF